MKYKLDKKSEGKNQRSLVQTTFFGAWDNPRSERVRGLPFRWFPYSEIMEKYGRTLLDHMTKHIDNEGRAVIECQPYMSKENLIDQGIVPFCEALGVEVSFGESDWNPPATISVEFRKK